MALLELAERCEAATSPDRELDDAIAVSQGWASHVLHRQEWLHPSGFVCGLPEFTASLDAAMTLVPEAAGFTLQQLGHPCIAQVFVPQRKEQTGCGYTPALALCAAALKARAAQPPVYDSDSESGALMDEPE